MTELQNIEVLLVEDNPNDAEMTIRALKKNNLANNLYHVEDGAEALDYIFCRGEYSGRINQAKPRLVILDLKLPKVDGLEVLKEMKSNESTKGIPVVIMTSSREESDVVRGYSYGVNSYVVKPVEFSDFVKAVSDLGLYWMLLNQVPDKR